MHREMGGMEDKDKILDELKASRAHIDEMIKSLEEKKTLSETPDTDTPRGGLAGIMDMSDPLKDIYLMLLQQGDMTMQEIMEKPSFEDKESLPIYVKILVRQGYLERYQEGETMKYRAIPGERGKKKVSEEIWEALK